MGQKHERHGKVLQESAVDGAIFEGVIQLRGI